MIAAAFRILFGFVLASFAAALTQVLFVITPADLYGLEGDARWQRFGFSVAIAASAATQIAIFAAPFALAAVLYGYFQEIRGWAFYVFCGLAIALLGLGVLYAGEGGSEYTIANGYAIAAYAFSGVIAGYVYWVVAGYRAGAGFHMRDEPRDGDAGDDAASSRSHLTAKDYEGSGASAGESGAYLSNRYGGEAPNTRTGGSDPKAPKSESEPSKIGREKVAPGAVAQSKQAAGKPSPGKPAKPSVTASRIPDAGGRRTH